MWEKHHEDAEKSRSLQDTLYAEVSLAKVANRAKGSVLLSPLVALASFLTLHPATVGAGNMSSPHGTSPSTRCPLWVPQRYD
jgi:hypothetical protein